jgi:catechol 2,3-dioxygenase-like lactoylglutathione lyase family enzyme
MAVIYIHTCYRILDPEKSKDFYVNKLGMKKLGEMDLGSATNHFFAMEEDASSLMLELTHNRDRTEPHDKGVGYAHVAFKVDDLVHIQDRCRVRRYSENHETSRIRPFTFGPRKRALGNRATLQRRFRHAPSPDHPRQSQERTRLANSPLIGVRLPDGARRHPRLQREGPCCSGGGLLATQAHPRRLRRGECRGFEGDAPPLPEGVRIRQ